MQEIDLIPIAKPLLERFKKNVKRNLTCMEYNPEKRAELIREIIGPYAIRNMARRARFYKIDYLTTRVNALKRFYIADMEDTVGSIFSKLLASGLKIYLHGGIIRDMIKGVRSADIDIIFDKDVITVKKLCDTLKWPCSTVLIREQYINFGTDKGASVEGGNLSKSFLSPVWEQENSVNSFAYDLTHDILIDVTGFGLVDIIHNQFRLGAHPDDWIKWAEGDPKRPFRYFKMIEKGYRPFTKDMHTFVVNYIETNWDSIYMKPISVNYPVPWIKHILVKTMTQGEINPETGAYTFGPTVGKLMPFLSVVKANVPRELFKKIMAFFSDEDLEKMKEARVITNDADYIKYRDLVVPAEKEISTLSTAKTKKAAKPKAEAKKTAKAVEKKTPAKGKATKKATAKKPKAVAKKPVKAKAAKKA